MAQDKDPIDGYVPQPNDPRDDAPPQYRIDGWANLDGFANELTGLGDPNQDKVLGPGGALNFNVNFLSGFSVEQRWRGSDLGGRIVEQVPDEMLREGWDLAVQPSRDEDVDGDEKPRADSVGWVRDWRGVKRKVFGRLDASAPPVPAGKGTPGAAPDPLAEQKGGGLTQKKDPTLQGPQPRGPMQPGAPAPPAKIPQPDEEAVRIQEAVEAKMRDLGARAVFREALQYERAYGGGGILLGVDDGEEDLTKPLDEQKVRGIKHLTAFRGGWDGELIAWRYYNDPRKPRYGEPEIYMLRNLGVPIAAPPAPGETHPAPPVMPSGPAGSLIFYVHESRLLIFPGQAVSRRARVQMRGWGDSVFTRVDEVLSQYSQTWSAVANLMTDWAQGVLKIQGLSELLASNDPTASGMVAKRMTGIQLSKSIARTMLLDAEEEFTREVTPLSGIADVLEQFSLRLSAAADMPVTLLMGQAPAGLNATGASDVRFFYDRIAAKQDDRLLPQLYRLIRLLFLAKDGPTKGKEPERWTLTMRALWQPTAQEEAELRNKQAQTDQVYLSAGVVTPEEIAVSRFGGAEYSMDTIIDFDGRAAMAAAGPPPGLPSAGGAPPPGLPPGAGPKKGNSPIGSEEPPKKPDLKTSSSGDPSYDVAKKSDADFREEDHPRDETGKFAADGSGGTAGGEHGASHGKGTYVMSKRTAAGLPKTHTPEEHQKIARAFLAEHAKGLAQEQAKLEQLAPPGAAVSGRVRDEKSAIEKLVRKPNYGDASRLQDGTGLRVVCKSMADVKATVEQIRATYTVVGEDDYIEHPKEDYRSHHLIIKGHDGLDKEVQVRTENEHTWADWYHDAYKPHTAEQRSMLKQPDVRAAVETYAHAMSEHFYAKDTGRDPGPLPEPSPVVVKLFGRMGGATTGDLLEHAAKTGGFTFNPATKQMPGKGYSVSVYPEHERVIEGRHPTGEDLERYFAEKREFVEGAPGRHLGLWHDVEKGKYYLDVTHVVGSKREATRLGKAHGQEGIYDLSKTGPGGTIIIKKASERR